MLWPCILPGTFVLLFGFLAPLALGSRQGERKSNAQQVALTGKVSGAPENNDRTQCIRQDFQDLVQPSNDENVLRMAFGKANDLGWDVYARIKEIAITDLKLKVLLKRTGKLTYTFKIYGEATEGDHNDCAEINFWLKGVDLMSRSTLISWGASAAADRDELMKGQQGSLKTKLAGEFKVDFDEEKKMYFSKVEKQSADPWQFVIANQGLLQKVLSDWGSIDQLIMDAIWPALQDALPPSFVAAINYMNEQDLGFDMEIDVTAKMPDTGGDLDVHAIVNPKKVNILNVSPSKLFEVYARDIDFTAIAEAKVAEFLDNPDNEKMWDDNRPKLIATLKKYGFKDVPELETANDLEDLRPSLIEAAKNAGDFLKGALEPFTKHYEDGEQINFFKGLNLQTKAAFVQKLMEDDGRMNAHLRSTDSSTMELMTLPHTLLDAFLPPILVPPLEGSTSSVTGAFELHRNHLTLPSVDVNQLTVLVAGKKKNETAAALLDPEKPEDIVPESTGPVGYEITGKAKELSVHFPESWSKDMSLTGKVTTLEVTPKGDWRVKVDQEGWVLRGEPASAVIPVAASSGPRRKGAVDKLDGALPERISRQAQDMEVINLKTLAPVIDAKTEVKLQEESGDLKVNVFADVTTTLDVRKLMSSFLAPRSTTDFGYAFASGTFQRQTGEFSEDIIKGKTTVVAVVNCGYLRLYTKKAQENYANKASDYPFSRIKFDVTNNGQLELDLTKYKFPPNAVVLGGKKCIEISSNYDGYRTVSTAFSWYNAVDEWICGGDVDVSRLHEAISAQIERFKDPRAQSWKYGTHLVDANNNELFSMAAGKESVDLSKIVEAGLR